MGTNSREERTAEAAMAKAQRRAWITLQELDEIMGDEMPNGMEVREIRIQGPTHTGGGYRAIVKGVAGAAKFVAFHNAESMEELLGGIKERLKNDGLKWKDDKPYGET